MFAKRFFYVCAGLLCLALAYHFGAQNAGAQAGSSVVGVSTTPATSTYWWVMTPNGDIYMRPVSSGVLGPSTVIGNFWDGLTPVQRETFGGVKARYR